MLIIRPAAFILFLALGLAVPVLAATAAAGNVAITGDSFVVDDAQHQATFTGNVVVTQSSLNLTADRVVANYGAAGSTAINSFEATGRVKIVTKGQTATGDVADYDPAARVLTLSGNVAVVSASGSVKGGTLVIDLKTNTSKFTGSKSGGRVTGVFSSQ
jgi:lipopolysaccharide export system protein LptA